jgi:hypothetical protein
MLRPRDELSTPYDLTPDEAMAAFEIEEYIAAELERRVERDGTLPAIGKIRVYFDLPATQMQHLTRVLHNVAIRLRAQRYVVLGVDLDMTTGGDGRIYVDLI